MTYPVHDPDECRKCDQFVYFGDALGDKGDRVWRGYQPHAARRLRLGADGIPSTAMRTREPRRADHD